MIEDSFAAQLLQDRADLHRELAQRHVRTEQVAEVLDDALQAAMIDDSVRRRSRQRAEYQVVRRHLRLLYVPKRIARELISIVEAEAARRRSSAPHLLRDPHPRAGDS